MGVELGDSLSCYEGEWAPPACPPKNLSQQGCKACMVHTQPGDDYRAEIWVATCLRTVNKSATTCLSDNPEDYDGRLYRMHCDYCGFEHPEEYGDFNLCGSASARYYWTQNKYERAAIECDRWN